MRLPAPEARDDAGRPELVLEFGPVDPDDAGADLHGAQLAVGDELADEPLGDGELVGGQGDSVRNGDRVGSVMIRSWVRRPAWRGPSYRARWSTLVSAHGRRAGAPCAPAY